MALNDAAVKQLGNAYLFLGDVGAADPTVAEINGFVANLFGAERQTVTVTGGPTGGSLTLTADAGTTGAIPWNATAAQVKTALVAVDGIDAQDVEVTGGPLPASPVVVAWTGKYQGLPQTLMTADDTSLTGGTAPDVTVTKTTLANGMVQAGHTSLDNDFSPFYDGGESSTRGTRQNPNLKTQVATVTEGLDVSLVQVDADTLRTFFGGGEVVEPGKYALPDKSVPIERSALMVYLADSEPVAWYRPKVSVFRNGPIRDAKDGWMEFPVRITYLELTGRLPAWYGAQIIDDTP